MKISEQVAALEQENERLSPLVDAMETTRATDAEEVLTLVGRMADAWENKKSLPDGIQEIIRAYRRWEKEAGNA